MYEKLKKEFKIKIFSNSLKLKFGIDIKTYVLVLHTSNHIIGYSRIFFMKTNVTFTVLFCYS